MFYIILTLIAIGGFISMSKTLKITFIISTIALIFYMVKIAGVAEVDQSLLAYKGIMGLIGLFVFSVIWSNIESEDSKKKFLNFVLKYGLGYFAFTMTLKLIFYFMSGNWSDSDLIVTILPYKIIGFIVVVLIFKSLTSKSNKKLE